MKKMMVLWRRWASTARVLVRNRNVFLNQYKAIVDGFYNNSRIYTFRLVVLR